MHKETLTVTIGSKTLRFETGVVARQANGSVMLHCGETVILSTACAAPTAAGASAGAFAFNTSFP